MSQTGLLDASKVEIKLGGYGVASAMALSDPSLHPRVQDYRRQSSARTRPLDKGEITERLPSAEFHVSRKIDGEFNVLAYRDGKALLLNPGGAVRVGIEAIQEAASLLQQAGVSEAMLAGELYVATQGRRPRVHDVTSVARNPDSLEDLQRLRFAPFDIISWNNAAPPDKVAEVWQTIASVFGESRFCRPPESTVAAGADDVVKLFEKWVEKEGEEGIVVRSETAGSFKIKPRHTLDAAVIGFTESIDDRQGMLHDMLLAVMREDGLLQILCKVGGGFNEQQRREMLSDLKDMVVDSEYAEVNSDHVAYQMVRPDWVVEISCLDLISQSTRGGPIQRMALSWDAEANIYRTVRRLPLVTVISPQFVRRREDKTVSRQDVRARQLADIVEIPLLDRDGREMKLPKSEPIRREVYTKQLKGKTMVRKLVMWQTNKQAESEEYPAYVVHYTDFSPNRASPLSREVRISNSREQIDSLWNDLKEANIKKGWNIVAGDGDGAQAPATEAAAADEAAETKAPKKKAAKKKAAKKPAKKAAVKKKAAKKKAVKKKAAKKKTAAKMAPSESKPRKKSKKTG